MISITSQAAPLAAVLVFSGGLISGLSPCTLPTVVFVVGYVGGYANDSKKEALKISTAFVLGLSLTLALTGALASMLGRLFLGTKLFWYVISAILIILGANLIGVLPLPVLSAINMQKTGRKGVLGAFLMGIPFAFAASPCTTPVTAAVLAYAASKGSPLYGFLLLFIYSIGRSIPLILAGTFTGAVKGIHKLGRLNEQLQRLSGGVLIVLGLWLLWTNI